MWAVLPRLTNRPKNGLVHTKWRKFSFCLYFKDLRFLGSSRWWYDFSEVRASCFADHRLYITTTTTVPQIKATATSDATHRTITIARESWVPVSSTFPWFFRSGKQKQYVMALLFFWNFISRVFSFRPSLTLGRDARGEGEEGKKKRDHDSHSCCVRHIPL